MDKVDLNSTVPSSAVSQLGWPWMPIHSCFDPFHQGLMTMEHALRTTNAIHQHVGLFWILARHLLIIGDAAMQSSSHQPSDFLFESLCGIRPRCQGYLCKTEHSFLAHSRGSKHRSTAQSLISQHQNCRHWISWAEIVKAAFRFVSSPPALALYSGACVY